MKTDDQIRSDVREHYSAIARGSKPGCCVASTPGTPGKPADPDATSRRLGYTDSELAAAPDGANLGLGCGNPQAIASLRAGEVVVDLGAGGGFDAFIAATRVGPTGRVIGVDMSADMVALARDNARKHAATNVEFRLGEIEHLPLPDASADVIISNCVINLAPDKRVVYADAFRVLRPGGRLAISDIVALAPMPDHVQASVAALCGCVAGAAPLADIEPMLKSLGFIDVRVEVEPASRAIIAECAPDAGFDDLVASAKITATKPGSGARAHAGGGRSTAGAGGAASTTTASRGPTAGGSRGTTTRSGAATDTLDAEACCKPGCCS